MPMNDADITALSKSITIAIAERMGVQPVYSKWLTVSEAMLYAEVKSRKTILAWINEGYIYAFRRTGSWIIDRESIDKWYNKDRF